MLACPPARVLDGAAKLGVFRAGELHGDTVGCWLDRLNDRAMADEWWKYRSNWTVVPAGRGIGDGY